MTKDFGEHYGAIVGHGFLPPKLEGERLVALGHQLFRYLAKRR